MTINPDPRPLKGLVILDVSGEYVTYALTGTGQPPPAATVTKRFLMALLNGHNAKEVTDHVFMIGQVFEFREGPPLPIPSLHDLQKIVNGSPMPEALHLIAQALASYGASHPEEWASLIYSLVRYPNGTAGVTTWPQT